MARLKETILCQLALNTLFAVCADYIEENKELYKFFIEDDESIEDYIAWIRNDARWGGQLEMNALAQIHRFNVVVHQVDNPGMA